VAAFLIERSAAAEGWLRHAAARVQAAAMARLGRERRRLEEPFVRLPLLLRSRLERERGRLELAQARVHAADPARLLARGFTLTTTADGKPLRFAADVVVGQELVTHFADGQVRSSVQASERRGA